MLRVEKFHSVSNIVKNILGINFKTLKIKRSWKRPKGKEENPHAGSALKIAAGFQKGRNESKVTSLKPLGKMVSIQRTVPKKAYIHNEGRKNFASFLAFLKVNQRLHKGEKKRRRKKPKNKFKKKKGRKKKKQPKMKKTLLFPLQRRLELKD